LGRAPAQLRTTGNRGHHDALRRCLRSGRTVMPTQRDEENPASQATRVDAIMRT
jgi:hypothetical protein